MTQSIQIIKPDDWHLHLRDDDMLRAVLPYSSDFARAIIMPNLIPPITNTGNAKAYADRIRFELDKDQKFTPLMTLYLTETTDQYDVALGYEQGHVSAMKLYPAGATTNSDAGVTDFSKIDSVLEKMSEIGMPLLMHGEVTDPDIDIFDREAVFIDRVLGPLRERHPDLKMILEHITTKDGVDYVLANDKNLSATITTHHLIINRNDMLVGGIKPHYYCLPIVKRATHTRALIKAAISGDPRFFLGTDSAPHLTKDKESACGCAGVFSSINSMSCLAHVFERENALPMLEGFTSKFGAEYYGLPLNKEKITLTKQTSPVIYPKTIETHHGTVTVFDPGFDLLWKVENK